MWHAISADKSNCLLNLNNHQQIFNSPVPAAVLVSISVTPPVAPELRLRVFLQFLTHFTVQTALGITELQCTVVSHVHILTATVISRNSLRQNLRWELERLRYVMFRLTCAAIASPKEHLNPIIVVTRHLHIPIDWLWTQSRNGINILSCYAICKICKTNNLSFYCNGNGLQQVPHTYLISNGLISFGVLFIWWREFLQLPPSTISFIWSGNILDSESEWLKQRTICVAHILKGSALSNL